MTKNGIQVVIFDLDGTLIDTEPAAAAVVQRTFEEWKIQIDSSDAERIVGRTWDSAFEFLFKKYRLPISDAEARTLILNRYREEIETHLKIVPGSVQAVESLAQSYSLGLVSGSRRTEILWALRKLKIESLFKTILGAEDYPKSKPQPDGYLKAITELSVEPHACLVFEDSSAGITAARKAGLWVVAVTSTNHFNQDFSGAHHSISDFQGVDADWVSKLKLS